MGRKGNQTPLTCHSNSYEQGSDSGGTAADAPSAAAGWRRIAFDSMFIRSTEGPGAPATGLETRRWLLIPEASETPSAERPACAIACAAAPKSGDRTPKAPTAAGTRGAWSRLVAALKAPRWRAPSTGAGGDQNPASHQRETIVTDAKKARSGTVGFSTNAAPSPATCCSSGAAETRPATWTPPRPPEEIWKEPPSAPTRDTSARSTET